MILMKIDGVDGDSDVTGHEKWIQCTELNWSAGRPIPTETGATKNRTGSHVQAKEITIKKKMDSTSSKLFELVCGTKGKKVEIHFLAGSGKQAQSYSEWTLEDALVSNYEIIGGVNAQDEAYEAINLNFVTLEIKSIPRGSDESASGPYPVKLSRATGDIG